MQTICRLAILALAAFSLVAPALAEPVSFRLIKHKVIVPITINGRTTFAAVDTAASRTTVDTEFAAELGITSGPPASTHGLNGGAVTGFSAPGVEIGLSGAATRIDALVSDGHMSKHLQTDVPVSIGHDLLKRHVVSIDFDKMAFDMAPVGSFAAFPKSEPVPLKPYGRNWSLPVEISGFGSMDALFDLGAEVVVIATDALTRFRLTFGRKTSTVELIPADGKTMPGILAPLREISLGGSSFRNVPAVLIEGPSGAIAGATLLSRFNLVIDLSRSRVWMTPNSRANLPFQ